MFLNTRILRKLMKQAYKTGLKVARTEERIYIAGPYWEVDIREEFMPKEILAQIIELTGEIPDIGEGYTATKEGNQYEIGEMEVTEEGYEYNVVITPLAIQGKERCIRILQDTTGKIHLVNNIFIDIADNKDTKSESGEYPVMRPMSNWHRGMLWKNNVARLHACWYWLGTDEDLITRLEGIRLSDGGTDDREKDVEEKKEEA